MDLDCRIINGDLAVDDRGELRFVNEFQFEHVRRFYQVENHRKNFIRAWHGHKKEGKYVYVASGTALVGVAPLMDEGVCDIAVVKKFVLSADTPSVLWIPPMHYNGFMNLQEDTKILFFSTSTLKESKGDDIRLPFDTWNIWDIEFR